LNLFNFYIATTIQAKSGLNEGQIEKMIKEAETMRKSDLAKRELVTVKNDIDTMIYEANKMINGSKDVLGEERIKKMQDIIKEINEKLQSQSDNLELLKELHDKIKSETMEAGKDIYNAGAGK
jgi:molecular chaperone DnaK